MEKALRIDYKERILQMARLNPLLPNDVAKAMGTNTIMASAILSELASKGVLKVSNIKIGSSPLYYPPNDGYKLQGFESYLNEKDRQTLSLLRENKILRDTELDPLTRVSLRQIKDFAVPLEVVFSEQKEIFWKWYLLQDSEIEQLIKEKIQPAEQKPAVQEQHSLKKEESVQEQKEAKDVKKKLRVKKKAVVLSGDLLEAYFAKNNVKISEDITSKKNSRAFIIQVQSSLGPLDYYSEYVFKKSVSEKDLSNAFVNGQLRKLPVIVFGSGALTKQAEEMLKELKGIAFKQIHGS